jgi:NADPH2:quinone reductase
VLRLVERPDAQAGVGEVLIRVGASGVNRPDVLQRTGNYPVPPGASDIPGLEVAGEIVGGDASAIAARGWAVGQRVCALVAGGGYAQLCAAPIGQCLPVPRGWTDVQAASLPETFFTVWSNVFDRCKLQAEETLLIQGGSSGIGVTAIQLAKRAGAQVIVTVGSSEKARACIGLGADHAIVYKSQDFSAEVLRLTHGRGAHVILDMVGGSYIPREIDCLADDGRLALIAVQGGVKAEINLGQILRRRLTLTGSTLRPRSVAFKAAIAQSLWAQVWPDLEAGRIVPVIHSTFAVADAARAHTLMESNQHIGKIVLTW